MPNRISSTAETIAFLRAGAGIPYADALASLSKAETATVAFYRRPDFEIDLERMRKMGSWAALRLHAVIEATRRAGARNILELASGFSPAGLISSEDPRIRYLESDLKPVIQRKRKMAREILGGQRKNLGFMTINALVGGDLERAVRAFFPKEETLTITHEGFLQYLTHEEKRQLSEKIAKVLRERKGTWVTSDIVLQEHFVGAFNTTPYARRIREILAENTGRDMAQLAFASFDEAEEMFQNAGFRVEKYLQLDLAAGLLSQEVLAKHRHLKHQQVWVMRPK